MFHKTLVFPARQPGGLAKMLNEQAELGFEYVGLYAENPNRPQHLTVLFRADKAPKVEKSETVKAIEALPAFKAEPVQEEEPEAPKTEEPAAKAPVKSKPGARRGRRAAVKKD